MRRTGTAPAADLVVVGSGLAGLSAALRFAERRPRGRVLLVTKTPRLPGGSSRLAQGGMAAAVGPDDAPRLHAWDTHAAAAGLGNPQAVAALTAAGPRVVQRVLRYGARLDRGPDGALALGREAAHGRARILHANGDATGVELVRALVAAVHGHPGIEVCTATFARELLVEGGRISGVQLRMPDGTERLVRAPHVLLATGGIGQLFQATTNPSAATGDGLAMAARAGALLVDLEMVQFHPTALRVPGADPLPLVTEALRGAGALLIDGSGHRFMTARHPDAELAPRDVVARAIFERLSSGANVFLDARSVVGEAFPTRFPTVYRLCRAHGIDPRREPIPVTPAAHYHMGGIAVDADGAASVPGLWAAGEVASTGAHGANRLASNSLLEALVWGERVADCVTGHSPCHDDRATALAKAAAQTPRAPSTRPSGADGTDRGHERAPEAVWARAESSWMHSVAGQHVARDGHQARVIADREADGVGTTDEEATIDGARAAIRQMAWQDLGLLRDGEGLRRVGEALAAWSQQLTASDDGSVACMEARNLALAGQLVAAGAWIREESRGAHARRDHPDPRPEWRRRIMLRLESGRLLVALGPCLGERAGRHSAAGCAGTADTAIATPATPATAGTAALAASTTPAPATAAPAPAAAQHAPRDTHGRPHEPVATPSAALRALASGRPDRGPGSRR